jgi:hypothetical protein
MDAAARYAWWPDVAVSPTTMRHHMVWHQRDEVTTLNYSIFTRQLLGTGFTSTARIESVTGVNELARIAFDDAGRGYVGFRTWNGTNYNVAIARYSGASWNYSAVIAPGGSGMWNVPTAADAGGNVTLAWRNWTGGYTQYAWRMYANGTNSGVGTVLTSTWDWDPELMATNDGRAFLGYTADRASQQWNGFAAVAGPGAFFGAAVALDANTANPAGGPKFSKGWSGSPARVHYDEYYDNYWHGQMREFNASNGSWSAPVTLGRPGAGTHIPDVAPMPDGGMMVVWGEDNATLGFSQMVAQRVAPFDTTAPTLSVASPANGSATNVSFAQLMGATEAGARLYVNSVEVVVAANGSFVTVVPLTNGTNVVTLRAVDRYGNWRNITHNVVFNDPALALIANLTAQNLALQAAFVAANNSLWAALAGQNASLLGQLAAQNASLAAAISAGDASLLAQLIAQNASLAAAIASGDAALLADLIAQNATLQQAISDGDAALLASLVAQNATLQAAIAAGDAALLASLAAQNASLLATIATTNASLLSQLMGLNASVTGAMSALNGSVQAEIAARAASDAELRQALADANASLLADLAALNADLLQTIADTNTELLASLAAQNDDLLARIGATNASLLAQLAATNATLWARLTADGSALWNALNATNDDVAASTATSSNVNSGQNTTLSAAQAEAAAARQAAASAGSLALMGLLIGLAGVAVAALALLMSRKRPPSAIESSPAPIPVEGVEVVDAGPPKAG